MTKFLVTAVVVLLMATFLVSLFARLLEVATMLIVGVIVGVLLNRWLVRD